MDKTASMRLTQLVAVNTSGAIHKQAGLLDDIAEHVKQNKKHYIRGGVGALAGAGLGAGILGSVHPKSPGAWIGGALGGAGVGAGVGVGGGMLYDYTKQRMKENADLKFKQTQMDPDVIPGDKARNKAKEQDETGYTEPSDLAPGDTQEINEQEWQRLNAEKAEAQKNSILRTHAAIKATKALRDNPQDTTLATKMSNGDLSARDLKNADDITARYDESVSKGEAAAEQFKRDQKDLAERSKAEEAGAKDRMDALRQRAEAQIAANQKAHNDKIRRKQFIDANVPDLYIKQFNQLTPAQQRNAQVIKALKESVYQQANAMYDQLSKRGPGLSLSRILFGR